MRQFSGNLLTILIMLLLGLSPLQAATDSFSDSFDQQGNTLQMVDAFDSTMTASFDYAVAQNCGQCNVNEGSFSHNYSSDHCVTCALTLPPITSHSPNPTITPDMLLADVGIVVQPVTSLFRPPKI